MSRGAREARERASQFGGRKNRRGDESRSGGMGRKRTRLEERDARREGRGERVRQLMAQEALARAKDKARDRQEMKAERQRRQKEDRDQGVMQERARQKEERKRKRIEGYRPFESSLNTSTPVSTTPPASVAVGADQTDTKVV